MRDVNERIKTNVDKILGYDLKKEILYPNEKKDFYLGDSLDLKLGYLVENLRDFKDDDFHFMDYSSNLPSIDNSLKELCEIFYWFKDFNPVLQNNVDLLKNKKQRLEVLFDCLNRDLISPFAPMLLRKKYGTTNLAKLEKVAGKYVEDMKSKAEDISKRDEATKKATGNIGSLKQSKLFLEESKNFRTKAKNQLYWLIFWAAIIFSVIVGLVFLTVYLIDKYPGLQWHILVSKFVILSILVSLFYLLIKNYNSSKHLEIINKHRANCLSTFETFYTAGTDIKIKDTILAYVAKSVFGHTDTGFIGGKKEKEQVSVVNLVDRITEK